MFMQNWTIAMISLMVIILVATTYMDGSIGNCNKIFMLQYMHFQQNLYDAIKFLATNYSRCNRVYCYEEFTSQNVQLPRNNHEAICPNCHEIVSRQKI